MRHYIIGDIHGCFDKLLALWEKIVPEIVPGDRLVFCGDYIDRGDGSFCVVEFLSMLSKKYDTVFLEGNHEMMLEGYLSGDDIMVASYLFNGGEKTIQSYSKEFGSLFIPESHRAVLFNHRYVYEGDDFFVVHAGFNPLFQNPADTSPYDCVWIREKFYHSGRIWDKTVVFGHTPTQYMGLPLGKIFIDDTRHLIGIDTGAFYGGRLTCLVWPDRCILQV